MQSHMTIEAAQKVYRKQITVGLHYTFYSDCVECLTDPDSEGDKHYIRSYSGQEVHVIDRVWGTDAEVEPQYKVRAKNGVTFQAGQGELNGWIFDTGQWLGPRIA